MGDFSQGARMHMHGQRWSCGTRHFSTFLCVIWAFSRALNVPDERLLLRLVLDACMEDGYTKLAFRELAQRAVLAEELWIGVMAIGHWLGNDLPRLYNRGTNREFDFLHTLSVLFTHSCLKILFYLYLNLAVDVFYYTLRPYFQPLLSASLNFQFRGVRNIPHTNFPVGFWSHVTTAHPSHSVVAERTHLVIPHTAQRTPYPRFRYVLPGV